MQTAPRVVDEVSPRLPGEELDAAEVHDALELILASQPFRTSKQCQSLLRHIVERSLRKDDAALRERVLGAEVFGRPPDYDTSEDPVVRMRAADVRKRLAQYYQGIDSEAPMLHVELKPGSYRAMFRYDRPHHYAAALETAPAPHELTAELLPGPPAPVVLSPLRTQPAVPEQGMAAGVVREAVPGAGVRRRRLLVLALAVLTLVGAGLVWRSISRWASPQRRFWAPLTAGRQPVLLYLGSNVAYRFTPEFQARYQREHGLASNGPEFFVNLPPNGTVQASDLVPVPSTFVTVGDLAASTQMVSFLNSWNRPFTLRSADDLSIGDLRNTPAVLIGGFNNRWTLETTNDLPFSFRDGTRIQDRDHAERSWTVPNSQPSPTTEDFALVSRLLQSKTGGPVLTVSGIGSFATQAAAEFVTSEDKVNALLHDAPAGWEHKNMQAVLRIKVVAFSPMSVEVVATTWW